jgi:hypothetical protein
MLHMSNDGWQKKTGEPKVLECAGSAALFARIPSAKSGAEPPHSKAQALAHSFRPLDAGGDIAARCPYREIPTAKTF